MLFKRNFLSLLLVIMCLFHGLNVQASNPINFISPEELRLMLNNGDIELIDVRNTEEFLSKHIKEARSVPLSILSLEQICDKTKKIVLLCASGTRSKLAAEKLKSLSGNLKIYSLKDGITKWSEKNYPTVGSKVDNNFPLNRQVQIAAGLIIVMGVILTILISRLFIAIPLFVGCGLIFAGISGWCGMAKLLALMFWN